MTALMTERRPADADGDRPRATGALTIGRVSLHYGSRRAVDDVSLTLGAGEILCLLGSSGSGKSSILRLIAGLEQPTSGTVALDGQLVAGDGLFVEPHARQVGMVFQDFALFPHLTVAENIAFGLRGWARHDVNRAVRSLLDDVGLPDRGDSYPHMLSGGERQRVALARALAPRPKLLLMDEPFSSLDTALREHVRAQTIALLRRHGTTTVLVTHDPSEALRVADRVGVLSRGKLVQFGTPAEIYERPCSPQMACALGAINRVRATVENGVLRTPLGVFIGPPGIPAGPATVCIRPQHVAFCAASDGLRAQVTGVTYTGDGAEVQLRVNDVGLVARVPSAPRLAAGDAPHISVDPAHLLVFPMHEDTTPPAA